MKNHLFLFHRTVVFLCASFIFTGCMTAAQKGSMGGAALGAAAGQIIGRDTESTLIGAGVGALSGALFNDYVDQQKKQAALQSYRPYRPIGITNVPGYPPPTQVPPPLSSNGVVEKTVVETTTTYYYKN